MKQILILIILCFSINIFSQDRNHKWSNRLKDNLAGLKFNNFEWRFEIFEGKNHNNSDIYAMINGLSHLRSE